MIVETAPIVKRHTQTHINKTLSRKILRRTFCASADSTDSLQAGPGQAPSVNSIGDFFANRVRTKELCVGDDTGGETCITKAQLDALLAGDGRGVLPCV